jgi:hypothetical protein
LTPEQKRKLERMIWMQRLKVLVPSVAVVLVLGGVYVWVMAEKIAQVDAVTDTHTVSGMVEGMPRLTGRRGAFQFHVRLQDGSEVDVASRLPQPPHDGERVELRASDHKSGRVTYAVLRLVD